MIVDTMSNEAPGTYWEDCEDCRPVVEEIQALTWDDLIMRYPDRQQANVQERRKYKDWLDDHQREKGHRVATYRAGELGR